MTAIDHNRIAQQKIPDDAVLQSDDRVLSSNINNNIASADNIPADSILSKVNISFNAQLRLRAYQEQKSQVQNNGTEAMLNNGLQVNSIENNNINSGTIEPDTPKQTNKSNKFPQQLTKMLSEVEQNVLQNSATGYQYLVNLLGNNKQFVSNPQQLQEIMRKEEFFLSRRKPFMKTEEYQSYSQVLSQFSNIVSRQQVSL